MPKPNALKHKPRFFRAGIARGLKVGTAGAPAIERDGGDLGGGVIRDYAVITRGEALGHDMWCDAAFLEQIAQAINESPMGVKTRFTHPGLSSDGLGKFLGRTKNARLDGDVVRGDLHLSDAAHSSPDGDLSTYVMNLAEKDPAAFGASIMFQHDLAAESDFMSQNGGEYDADEGEWEGFTSPDADNVEHLPHSRLGELRASDIVDDPAANPAGLFHRGEELFEEASAVCAYGLGLTDDMPATSEFDVHPERLRGFVSRFLSHNGLEIKRKEKPAMAESTASTTDPIQPNNAETQSATASVPTGEAKLTAAAECKRFVDAFGAQGGVWFAEGKTFDQAQQLAIEALRKENAELTERLQQAGGGQSQPVSFSGEKQPGNQTAQQKRLEMAIGPAAARFAQAIKIPGR